MMTYQEAVQFLADNCKRRDMNALELKLFKKALKIAGRDWAARVS